MMYDVDIMIEKVKARSGLTMTALCLKLIPYLLVIIICYIFTHYTRIVELEMAKSAGIIIIGDEILKGQTQVNICSKSQVRL